MIELKPEESEKLRQFVSEYKKHEETKPIINQAAIDACYNRDYIPPELQGIIEEEEIKVTLDKGKPAEEFTVYRDIQFEIWQTETDQIIKKYQQIIDKANAILTQDTGCAQWESETIDIIKRCRDIGPIQLKEKIQDYIERTNRPTVIKDRIPEHAVPVDPVNTNSRIWSYLLTVGEEPPKAYRIAIFSHEPTKEELEAADAGEKSADIYITFNRLEEKDPAPTQYDKEIYDAIASHFLDFSPGEQKVVTLKQIYNTYRGTEHENPHTVDIEKIKNSIDKLRHIEIIIDNRNETRRASYKLYNQSKHMLLNVDTYDNVVYRGQPVRDAIEINQFPVLMQFAQTRNQIIKVQNDAYFLPVNLTETTSIYRTYLLKEIDRINKKLRANKKILYQTIFDAAGVTETNRHTAQRQKATIKKILDNLAAAGYMNGYKETNDGIIITPKRSTTQKQKKS